MAYDECRPKYCNCSFNGGTNGSNGQGGSSLKHSTFGHGSGVDLASLVIKHWTLTPGKGGDEYHHSHMGDQYFGGGGGGVVVAGTGPSRDHLVQGEGYGGGGGSQNPHFYPGLPGVILMEVGP